jgi:thymidylate synthase ThyX
VTFSFPTAIALIIKNRIIERNKPHKMNLRNLRNFLLLKAMNQRKKKIKAPIKVIRTKLKWVISKDFKLHFRSLDKHFDKDFG